MWKVGTDTDMEGITFYICEKEGQDYGKWYETISEAVETCRKLNMVDTKGQYVYPQWYHETQEWFDFLLEE